MKRISQFACGIAVIVMAAIAVSSVYAQSVTARALFTYPMHGQTPEQESADRAACPALFRTVCPTARPRLPVPPAQSAGRH